MSEITQVASYVDAPTQVLSASNLVDYAYRATGPSDATPLVTFQHFRGTSGANGMHGWAPEPGSPRGRRTSAE